MSEKYKYHCRPGYGSDKLLIEFFSGVEKETFQSDFFSATNEINPSLTSQERLLINDEILFSINSDFGQFSFSIDSWDIAFIMAENNQSCILKINELLQKDKRFEKIEVDFDAYINIEEN